MPEQPQVRQPQPQVRQPRAATIAEVRALELMESLWKDKTVGAAVRKAAKEKYPDITLPEETMDPALSPMQDEIKETRAELKAMREERAAEKKDREETSLKRTIEDGINGAREKYRLTDEGFDKMIKRMKDTGNYSDPEAAGAWVAQSEPPQQSPGPSWAPQQAKLPGSPNDDAKLRKLITDPMGFADDELREFVKNPDQYVTDTFGRAA